MARRAPLLVLALLVLGAVAAVLVSTGMPGLDGFVGELRILAGSPAAAADSGAAPTTTIFLVRHAEPVYPPPAEAPRDPPLNRRGRERAARLARVLGDAGIGAVLSSDYRRTRDTAAPLAARLGLEIELYDPRALAELAERLHAGGGRVLVAGHSNTTPELVELLGGEPGSPIDEETEFDRLYVVTLRPDGEPVTTLLRYGEPPAPWPSPDRDTPP